MYYGYSIVSGKEKSNYIRGGEYTGVCLMPEKLSQERGSFIDMNSHKERVRINEIDNLLYETNEEYISLSRSVITASDAVKAYVQQRINELHSLLERLNAERKRLLLESN